VPLLAICLWITDPSIIIAKSDPPSPGNVVQDESLTGVENHLNDLCRNFCHELDRNNDARAFDSLAQIAIETAESTFDPDLILQTNLKYLEKIMEPGKRVSYSNILERTETLIQKKNDSGGNFDKWIILAKSAARLRMDDISHKYALKAFSEANMSRDAAKKARSYLVIGKSLELQKHYVEAYQNFLNALYQSEMLENGKMKDALQIECFDYISSFFAELKDYDSAAENKSHSIRILESAEPVDSSLIQWAYLDLYGISLRAGRYYGLAENLDKLIEFAIRNQNKKLEDYSFALYRTFLIDNRDFGGLHRLYELKFPEKLQEMEGSNPILYFRILAYLAEYKKDMNEAKSHYQKTEALLNTNGNPIFQSNFYKRYGEFLLRNNEIAEAKEAFLNSYELARQSAFDDFIFESSAYIDSMSSMLGHFEEAYHFSKIHYELQKKQNEKLMAKDFLLMEIRNEAKRMELEQQKAEESRKKKFNLQYMLITISITILMLLFFAFSHMKVPVWAVKGSGFLGILMIFEFIILILDQEIHHITHGAPFWIFVIKVIILFVLFPLHHVIEHSLINYMLKHKLVSMPQGISLKKIAHKIWPWMKG